MRLHSLLPVALAVLLISVAGHTPKRRRTGKHHSRPHTLHPTVHPSVDTSDLSRLAASEGLSLHYHDPHAAFKHIRSFASVHISGFHHPAVALEHSVHVSSTTCDSTASTITIAFTRRDAWSFAFTEWKRHPQLFLVAFADSCGLGRESGERSIHLARNCTSSWTRMEITCEMTETALEDAIHPDREVEIVADTFEVHNPAPPVTVSRIQRRDDGEGGDTNGNDGDGGTGGGSDGTDGNAGSDDSNSDGNDGGGSNDANSGGSGNDGGDSNDANSGGSDGNGGDSNSGNSGGSGNDGSDSNEGNSGGSEGNEGGGSNEGNANGSGGTDGGDSNSGGSGENLSLGHDQCEAEPIVAAGNDGGDSTDTNSGGSEGNDGGDPNGGNSGGSEGNDGSGSNEGNSGGSEGNDGGGSSDPNSGGSGNDGGGSNEGNSVGSDGNDGGDSNGGNSNGSDGNDGGDSSNDGNSGNGEQSDGNVGGNPNNGNEGESGGSNSNEGDGGNGGDSGEGNDGNQSGQNGQEGSANDGDEGGANTGDSGDGGDNGDSSTAGGSGNDTADGNSDGGTDSNEPTGPRLPPPGNASPNDTSDNPDLWADLTHLDEDALPFNADGTINDGKLDAIAAAEQAFNDQLDSEIGYYSFADDGPQPDEIEEYALAPEGKLDLERRGQCKLSWNPWAMARDCVLLPLAKAVLPASVYNIVEAVLSLDIKAIYKFFSAAVKIIVAILSEKGYTPSGEVTWDTNVTKPMELTEEFGYAYNLLTIHPTEQSSEDGKSVLGSLRLACVGCRADGYLKHRSKVRFTFSKGFTDAEVEIVDGHMDYSAGIGIVFELDFKGDIFKQNVVKVPLSPLAIPGIIIIGPYLSLDCGLGYDIGAKGTAVARNNIGWSNMTAKLDMVHGDKSFIGKWIETEPVPLISIEVEGHATLDPYVSGGIYFGIDVLNGKFTISAGLEAKVSLPVTLKTAITSDGNDVSFKGCKGIDASLSAKVEWYLVLEAGKYQQHYAPDQVPHEKEWPIYSECIGLPEAKTKNQLGQDVPVPTLPPPRPDEVYRTITAHFPDGNLDVVWLNGNLFAITPQDPNTAQFTANRYFIGLKSLSATNATVGSYDNGVFVAYYKDIRTYGVSRFELAYQDKIPKDAVVVGLRSETGKNGEPAFLTAVTTITSERWYLLLCLFKDRSLPPKIVIARNPEEGARTMEYNNNNKANTNYFAGKPVLSCKFSKFTIS